MGHLLKLRVISVFFFFFFAKVEDRDAEGAAWGRLRHLLFNS